MEQRGELGTEGNEGDERTEEETRGRWGRKGETDRKSEREVNARKTKKEDTSELDRGRECDNRRERDRTGGDGGESEGGSRALARPVMIDWLAGSQQTDVCPPDQPVHPRTNPPLLSDSTVHHVSFCFLSLLFSPHFSDFFT